MAMANDYKELFQPDGTDIDTKQVVLAINRGEIITIDAYGYAVGCVAFSGVQKGLNARISGTFRPSWFKRILRQDLIHQAIGMAFDSFDLQVIYAWPQKRQTQATRLLKRLGFHKKAQLDNFLMAKGEPQSVVIYQLTRPYWEINHG